MSRPEVKIETDASGVKTMSVVGDMDLSDPETMRRALAGEFSSSTYGASNAVFGDVSSVPDKIFVNQDSPRMRAPQHQPDRCMMMFPVQTQPDTAFPRRHINNLEEDKRYDSRTDTMFPPVPTRHGMLVDAGFNMETPVYNKKSFNGVTVEETGTNPLPEGIGAFAPNGTATTTIFKTKITDL